MTESPRPDPPVEVAEIAENEMLHEIDQATNLATEVLRPLPEEEKLDEILALRRLLGDEETDRHLPRLPLLLHRPPLLLQGRDRHRREEIVATGGKVVRRMKKTETTSDEEEIALPRPRPLAAAPLLLRRRVAVDRSKIE